MSIQTKVTGVVLAGGKARRMGGQDKGLVIYKHQPMVQYAINALTPLCSKILLNANRNQNQYRRFGWPVIADQSENFDGPLAGILSAMLHCESDLLLVTPCDSPMIESDDLQRLLQTRSEQNAEIAVAYDGQRMHPVFLALKTHIAPSLQQYLDSGERKIDIWLTQHNYVLVDFSDCAEKFMNINTLDDLSDMESGSVGC